MAKKSLSGDSVSSGDHSPYLSEARLNFEVKHRFSSQRDLMALQTQLRAANLKLEP